MKYLPIFLFCCYFINVFAQNPLPKHFNYDDVFFEVGQKNRISVLFEFDSDKLVLTKGVDSLVTFLKINPRLHIRIEHHFDSRWTDFYSSRLDFERAKSVKRYLIHAGIAEERLEAIGKGDREILNHCKEGVDCSDAEHQVNRRTMAVITKIDTLPKYDYFTFEDSVFEVGQVYQTNLYIWNKFIPVEFTELEKITSFLKKNPTIFLNIECHIDSRGNDNYNLRFTQRVLEIRVEYLVNKGIAPNRIKAIDKGDSEILNHCKNGVECSDEEHRINRRIILRITKI